MKKQSFFQKRSVTAIIGIIALLGGFYFLNSSILTGTVTGNTITSNVYSFNFVSIIGILLILCSAILIVYAIVKQG